MLIYAVLAFSIVWTATLTYLFIRLKKHYDSLTANSSAKTLENILDSILVNEKRFENQLETLKKEVEGILNQSTIYYKKIGFVRFNPFDRLAGEQSFVIALLNEKDNGILLSFLYTREGVRVYAKRVVAAKGDGMDLSEEEKKAIKGAK